MKTKLTNDKHENKNWEFRQSKPDPILPGQFIRLYRNRQNPALFKRVAKRTGSSACNLWDAVTYTMRGENGPLVDRYGRMFWVRSVEAALRIPDEIAAMEAIYKNNEQ